MPRSLTRTLLPLLLCFFARPVLAQSYHAINGSPYAGAAGMYVNPANTVNSAHKWDVALFGLQFTTSNSAFYITQMSVTHPDSSVAHTTNTTGDRSFHNNVDLSLLNILYKIDDKQAVAFGLRGRMYNHAVAAPFNYSDTVTGPQGFLTENSSIPFLEGYGTHAAWLEADLNYSRVLAETENTRLSGGITIGLQKSISGAHGDAQKVSFLKQTDNNGNIYFVPTGGIVTAEYSANYDTVQNVNGDVNLSDFFKGTHSSLNLSFGFEYLIKPEYGGDEPVGPLNYLWKFGLSVMDIGTNTYQPSSGSFRASAPLSSFSDLALQQKLANAGSLQRIQDSLRTAFATLDSLSAPFTIANPTRIVLSADRKLGRNLYVNGELNVNLFSTRIQEKLKTREINLLTITPRWETRAFGFYLPIQYNSEKQFWVGAAVKLGPLLLGVHSLDFINWFKTGTQTFNGGAYLLLSIHPFGKKEHDDAKCPHA